MSYTALYRKWRPKVFEDVKGQDHIVVTLQNQILSQRIGHAYLFCGTRGTGKTSVAKIFARAVNCEHPVNGSPCGECASCRQIQAGTSLNVVEIDAASNNGVENIREIREQVQYPPTEGRFRVYIIDEVHMLSAGAFNALLKTLEEPPSYVIFILATTEVHKIPITVLSRCQRYDFRRITVDTITDRLKELTDAEGMPVEEKALRYVAKAGDGSMRDALSLLDQCAAFHYGETLTYEHVLDVLGAVDNSVFRDLFHAVVGKDTKKCILKLEEMVIQGRELSQFVVDFIWYLRNLLMLKSDQGMEEILDVSSENLARMREEIELTDADTLMRYIRVFSELSGQIRYATQKRVLVEIALIKLCKPSMERSYDSILQRLSQLEQQMEQGIPAMPARSAVNGESVVVRPAEKISPEALPKDIQEFIGRYQEIRKKTGSWSQFVLKGSQCRELPDHAGVQIILCKEYAVDEKELAEEIEHVIEKELNVRMRVQVCTPKTDTRPQDPVIDLSKAINMDIDIE